MAWIGNEVQCYLTLDIGWYRGEQCRLLMNLEGQVEEDYCKIWLNDTCTVLSIWPLPDSPIYARTLCLFVCFCNRRRPEALTCVIVWTLHYNLRVSGHRLAQLSPYSCVC
jgi:hypothetical protein